MPKAYIAPGHKYPEANQIIIITIIIHRGGAGRDGHRDGHWVGREVWAGAGVGRGEEGGMAVRLGFDFEQSSRSLKKFFFFIEVEGSGKGKCANFRNVHMIAKGSINHNNDNEGFW